MRRLLRPVRNERGATFVFFVGMTVALLSLAAIAVDTGMMYTVRSEAQRAAEAAALAGAGLYVGGGHPTEDEVEAKAREFAGENQVGHHMIDGGDTSAVKVEVFEGEQRVRVTIGGTASLLFARLFGRNRADVSAVAAARVRGAGAAKCVKPFAISDMWDDANTNNVFDEGETYKRYDPMEPDDGATGYGSDFRDGSSSYTGDYGRQLQLTATVESTIKPSVFWPLNLPNDPNIQQGYCKPGAGRDDYRWHICSCNNVPFQLGEPGLELFNGGTIGQTHQGLRELYDEDSKAKWVEVPGGQGYVKDSKFTNWVDSPRVIKVALFDPTQHLDISPGAGNRIVFNNIALLWLDEVPKNGNANTPFTARFLYYAPGEGAGEGTLVRTLQLVE